MIKQSWFAFTSYITINNIIEMELCKSFPSAKLIILLTQQKLGNWLRMSFQHGKVILFVSGQNWKIFRASEITNLGNTLWRSLWAAQDIFVTYFLPSLFSHTKNKNTHMAKQSRKKVLLSPESDFLSYNICISY